MVFMIYKQVRDRGSCNLYIYIMVIQWRTKYDIGQESKQLQSLLENTNLRILAWII